MENSEAGGNNYNVTADVDVTYGLVETGTRRYTNNFVTKEDEIPTTKEILEKNGGIVLEISADDDTKTVYYTYVRGVSYNAYEYGEKERAEKAAEKNFFSMASSPINKLENQAEQTGQEVERVIWNKNITNEEVKEGAYNFVIRVLRKPTTTTDNTVISTETYANAESLEGQIIQNLNYENGDIKLTQDDDAYRNFVDSATDLAAKYDRLLEEAQTAKEDVEAAQEKVDELVAAIAELEARDGNSDELVALKAQLDVAEADVDAAEETLENVKDKLETAEKTLEEVIQKLTPDEGDDSGDGGDGDDGGSDGDDESDVSTSVAPTTPGTNPADSLVASTDTPVNVLLNATAATAAEGEKIPWPWWILILILGATGYEMYKKHQQKKKTAGEVSDKE